MLQKSKTTKSPKLFNRILLTTCLCTSLLSASAIAATQSGSRASDVIIGQDDDNTENPIIQPEEFGGTSIANQSLNNTDIIAGGFGNDVLIGRLGSDVMSGGPGSDILIGGIEKFNAPNNDILFGNSGHDINIWAPGDGSDAFYGGHGIDAMVFAKVDLDENDIPKLGKTKGRFRHTGIPSLDASNSPGFCTLEKVKDTSLGVDYLVRFFVRAADKLAVTVRLKDVEQVFCTSETGGEITYANLRERHPEFVVVTPEEIRHINRNVAEMIR